MKKFIENLKTASQENPLLVLGVAAGLITATAKFIDSFGHAAGSMAYARQVNHRVKKG